MAVFDGNDVMRFQLQCFQLKSGTPVFREWFSFSRKSISKLKY